MPQTVVGAREDEDRKDSGEVSKGNSTVKKGVNARKIRANMGPYVSGHQFGLSTVQGFHNMTQFSQMQESSTTLLQQQSFHGNTQLGQNDVQACPAADVNSLQFGGSNPQIGHQSSDQGHYSIPVWDFL
ncbi:hypothetical protein COCNU_06G018810 [Cocos nucifera]|uniref:Uncharacterized protein n=1 Tax=Cocos nucifera TaxID=13894 RepID=A0A8K0N4G6_COCNU|nr:hypothetical protein COCNU_06G018810 [Cocos nucifera]